MSPQFSPQASRLLTPCAIRSSIKHGRDLIELIEKYHDPKDFRQQQQLTRAINGLASWASSLADRRRRQVDPAYMHRRDEHDRMLQFERCISVDCPQLAVPGGVFCDSHQDQLGKTTVFKG